MITILWGGAGSLHGRLVVWTMTCQGARVGGVQRCVATFPVLAVSATVYRCCCCSVRKDGDRAC